VVVVVVVVVVGRTHAGGPQSGFAPVHLTACMVEITNPQLLQTTTPKTTATLSGDKPRIRLFLLPCVPVNKKTTTIVCRASQGRRKKTIARVN